MVADDSYTAADERARAARRAGLQAKKDEQPANTARSYAAKQREWKARPPRPAPPLSPLLKSLGPRRRLTDEIPIGLVP
jgi:hypothetical protein